MPGIDTINKALLNNIQTDLPIDPRPFRTIAQKLGLTEDEVSRRTRQMKEELLIRRIGGNFSPDKGFVLLEPVYDIDHKGIEEYIKTLIRKEYI